MEQFFKSPHLPDSKVRALIVGECYAARLSPALESFGVRVIPCPRNPYVDARLSYHSDLSVYHVGGKCFYLARHLRDSELAKELEHLGASVRFSKARQGGEYPLDASLCALPLGDAVYHNAKICDELIVQSTSRFENIKQGYAKCAVCPVSSDAAITADKGVARVLEKNGVRVLQVLPGGILLDGFDEGFIGGAAFKIAPDVLAFTGRLDLHPDKEKIEEFLSECGVRPEYLTAGQAFDIGSAFPIY